MHLNLDLFRTVPKLIQTAESDDYSPWVEAHEDDELRSLAEEAVQL